MIRRSIRSLTAALLLVLLGILTTGLPSHSHESDRPGPTRGELSIRADVHSHGVVLLEGAERVPSTTTMQVAAPAITRLESAAVFERDRRPHAFDAQPLRPSERGPPPAAPRAPPSII